MRALRRRQQPHGQQSRSARHRVARLTGIRVDVDAGLLVSRRFANRRTAIVYFECSAADCIQSYVPAASLRIAADDTT